MSIAVGSVALNEQISISNICIVMGSIYCTGMYDEISTWSKSSAAESVNDSCYKVPPRRSRSVPRLGDVDESRCNFQYSGGFGEFDLILN